MHNGHQVVENFEVMVTEDEGQDVVILTFEISDAPSLQGNPTKASLVVEKDGTGSVQVDFRGDIVVFPEMPSDLTSELGKFDAITVAALNPDGVVFSAKLDLSKT